jgi:hypothetical protein
MKTNWATVSVLFFPLCLAVPAQADEAKCVPEKAAFAAGAGNQVKGAALMDTVKGKTIVFARAESEAAAEPQTRIKIDFRADGTALWRCTARAKASDEWKRCPNFSKENAKSPDREIGSWKVDGDAIVVQRAKGSAEGRFTLHSEKDKMQAQLVSGTHYCMPGRVKFE